MFPWRNSARDMKVFLALSKSGLAILYMIKQSLLQERPRKMSVSQILRTGAGVLIGCKSELSQWKYGTSTRESIAPTTCLKMLRKKSHHHNQERHFLF